ncbi:hypothetical protein MRX96_042838 [Rhipicephalus microplus]
MKPERKRGPTNTRTRTNTRERKVAMVTRQENGPRGAASRKEKKSTTKASSTGHPHDVQTHNSLGRALFIRNACAVISVSCRGECEGREEGTSTDRAGGDGALIESRSANKGAPVGTHVAGRRNTCCRGRKTGEASALQVVRRILGQNEF